MDEGEKFDVSKPIGMELMDNATNINTSSGGSSATRAESEDQPSQIEIHAIMAMLVFFSIIGVTGNSLVVYVYSRKRDKLTSTIFILTLAITDLMVSLVTIPYTIVMEYLRFEIGDFDFLCKLYHFLITCTVPFAALIMVAIAIDRYFCICHPFLHAMTAFRAKVIIICFATLACTLGTFTSLFYGVYEKKIVNSTMVSYVNSSQLEGESTRNISSATYTVLNNALLTTESSIKQTENITYTGVCAPSFILLDDSARRVYQKISASIFLISFIMVVVLYVMIYHSVLARRSKRLKQRGEEGKSMNLHVPDANSEETQLTSTNGHHLHATTNGSTCKKKQSKAEKIRLRRKSTLKDKAVIANLKTAIMLFVVTLVFIVFFLPAWLIALHIIPFNIIVFYMYFAYNVANPIIYSFMNVNFRDDLKLIFNCKKR
ncbi:unnamed protein product [Owenia fusiformis]|uniref:G-protein coupled receptors family 1 profile domain-containing protein n=1 Tax=Owenia fusiformis TaxID=6347 RepID=A0A8S4N0Y7_OWEFU|nr:unnamed protein product [Owenia fusiformis]